MSANYLSPNQPDILEVISNLSSDEVFTPPKVANAVLDLLPDELWRDPNLRWLDPGCKTGIFPREITKRLMVGLTEVIPNESARLEHILKNMVFALAITDLTSMMTRRTLYCSKDASSPFSVYKFATASGNVWHERVTHNFDPKGRCLECGGTSDQLEVAGRDNYAYGFIHSAGIASITKEIEMKFDVIVGNPPYQMDGGGGGTNATPLYDVFVQQAKVLNPSYIAMIIPSRWMAGGRGLEEFRAEMLTDQRIRKLVDFPNASELFPGVEIKGGVCYFLWDRNKSGTCEMTIVRGDERHGPEERNLGEFDVLVRDSRALSILRKVLKKNEASFSDLVSGDTPFGLASNFKGYRKGERKSGDIKLYLNEGGARVEKFMPGDEITKSSGIVQKWKVLVPKAGSDGGQKIPDSVIGIPFIAGPKSACTQTYLFVGPLDSKAAASSVHAYMQTKFVRFLVSLRKISQDAMKSVYTWVPQQNWDHDWSDLELYKKYGITKDEQTYIEMMIKEMLS
jgi:site-specific DNA-methyltransferase (adenine-specific)